MSRCLSRATLITLLLPFAPNAFSAESVGISFGVDHWWSSTHNRAEDDGRNVNDDTSSFYFDIEHDVQYVPNFKLRYSSVNAPNILSLDKYDYTFYYDIIEHELLQFDLGLTLSQYKNTKYQDLNSQGYDFNSSVWSIYAAGVIEIPNTNLDIIGQFDFADRDVMKSAEVMAGLQYRIDIPVGELALRGGYRVMDYTFKELGTPEDEELLVDGWFTGLQFSF
ncbi:TIGR04219 family outer membrane beta-barrel protein [Vibrio sp. HN007]|uniref:TIGR04219 family outer membrane beta-barrel protein n=1 Tax=Vibrio iocasae TaxID=3098914 RepID=UPI0035D4D43A